MKFEHKALKLIDSKTIAIPEQKISSNFLINNISKLAISLLEEKVLGINKTLNVIETTYKSPIETRF